MKKIITSLHVTMYNYFYPWQTLPYVLTVSMFVCVRHMKGPSIISKKKKKKDQYGSDLLKALSFPRKSLVS